MEIINSKNDIERLIDDGFSKNDIFIHFLKSFIKDEI